MNNHQLAAPSAPTRAEAFRYWLKLGFISFGGPAGQIAIMHAELVERQRWISERRFLHALNYCMVLPGPEAQQLATYIGWLLHRTWGGVVAGGLFVLPSLFILVALSWVYLRFGDVPAVAGVLYGIKPAVTAIVLFAAWRIGSRALKHRLLWAIAAAAFVAIFAFHLPFPLIVVAAALCGHLGARWVPQAFSRGCGHAAADTPYGAAVIDDDTPTPAHALWSTRRSIRILLVFFALWAAALGGLALGETTPGPLIMIVAFVGFVGGWGAQVLGPDALFASGLVAATVVSFFTFLPSFLFILLGAPFIESTHGQLEFTAPLTGITAAVVGVIVNLAAFFAYHVLWPQGFSGRFDALSAVVAVAAAVALFRFKVGVMPLLGACAAVGLAVSLWLPGLR